MNNLRLKQNGLIFLPGENEVKDPLKFLNYQVELVKDYTLRSYFETLNKYPLLSELNDFYPFLRDQYIRCPEKGCSHEYLDYLLFCKTVEMIGFPGKRLEIYNSFKGVRGEENIEIKSTQLEDILDLPIRLGKLKHIIFGDQVDIFEFDTVYTFFEFLDGVAWELSFHGTPKQCDIGR